MKDKEKRILLSAIELFSKNGYGNTTTASIAEKANVGAGTLFIYFPTKLDLFHQALLYANKDFIDYVKDLNEKKDFKRGMIEVWDRMVDYALMKPYEYSFIVQSKESALVNEDFEEELFNQGKFFSKVYNKFQSKGEVKEPFELFSIFMFHDVTATVNFINDNPDMDVDKIKRIGFDFLWKGVSLKDD